MNRGHILQSSPVQQMMTAGSSPNWWSNMRPPPSVSHQQQVFSNSSSSSSSSSFLGSAAPPNLLIPNSQFIPTSSSSWGDDDDDDHHNNQQLPESWSQLLMGGLMNEEGKISSSMQQLQQANKKLEMNWEEQILLQNQQASNGSVSDHFKNDENSVETAYSLFSSRPSTTTNWSTQVIPVSSPTSCVTTLSSTNNMLDFSSSTNNHNKSDGRHPPPDRSSECNSTGGGAAKKARVQTSSTQSTFKVRKEKLGDRITALHQIVSPFGKTDTASVLLEAIGYIRFLQSQIEALSLPYLGNSKSGNMRQQQQHHVQGGERNCLFPEDPGQVSFYWIFITCKALSRESFLVLEKLQIIHCYSILKVFFLSIKRCLQRFSK
ncbi:OLC1v1037375C4 [Oldenlandia corymbosa var. corymbosa]|uniref:OLC1v1037375C4 n=1 Tax=Oldenlandia corymbosa var. corymbosa TaxID=529605 RepID=A0AAV1CYX3_OLDCO|nr:OLC1v1037375C4 [Oldenlandia corymbosa var. corymbosa]